MSTGAMVGRGFVQVMPSMRGFRKTVDKEMDGAAASGAARFQRGMKSAGAKSGRELGTGVKSAFSSSTQGLGDAALRSLNKEVASASKALSAARLKQQDQAGRVRTAEARLAEAVQRSGKESATAIGAAERLESARRRQVLADDAVKASSERLAEAKRRVAGAAKDAERAASGMGSTVGAKLSGLASSAGRWGADVGRKFAAGLQSAATAGVAAAGAALSVSLVAGFNRLTAIDTAQAKLRGFGHDADTVAQIMADAGASVKGTAFGLGDAATVAAAAVAANIKPGEALQGHLSNIANMAAATGQSMTDMGSLFNKAATQVNGVQNDVIGQLADKGIPIYQKLGEQMGVTAGEVFEMASRGEVDFATFSKAAEAAAGTVAEEMGATIPASLSNLRAAMGRIGANLLGGSDGESGIYSKIAPLIQAATQALGPLEEKAKAFGDMLGEKVGPILEKITGWLERLGDDSEDAEGGLSGLGAVLGPLGGGLAALGAGGLAPLLSRIPMLGSLGGAFSALGGPIGIAAAALAGFMLTGGDAGAVADGITSIVDGIVGMLPGLISTVVEVVPKILDGILAALPGLLEAGVSILETLISGIITALPLLIEGALALVNGLMSAIVENLPLIIEGAVTLVVALVQGLVQALPALISGAITLVMGLVTALIDNLPLIIEAGITLLLSLVEGLIVALPMLIEGALQLVLGLATALIDNLPLIIEAGIQLLLSLVLGLIGALPDLIVAAIDLVIALATGILDMLPELITAGIELIFALIEGLVGAIPDIIAAIPQIIEAIWNAIVEVDWIELGVKIIEGLIEGIGSMVGAVGDAIGGIVQGIADFFPHSPAKKGPLSGRGYPGYSGRAMIGDFADSMLTEEATVAAAARRVASAASTAAELSWSSTQSVGPGRGGRGSSISAPVTINAHGLDAHEVADVMRVEDSRTLRRL